MTRWFSFPTSSVLLLASLNRKMHWSHCLRRFESSDRSPLLSLNWQDSETGCRCLNLSVVRTYNFISSINKAIVNLLIVHLLCSPCTTGSAGSGSDISSWSVILWMQERGVFGVNIATSYATEAFFRTRVREVARHKAVITNVLGADEIKPVFQRLLLELIAMGQPMPGITERAFLAVPINRCMGFLLWGRVDGEVGRLRGWLVPELRSSRRYWVVLCNISKDGVCGSTKR